MKEGELKLTPSGPVRFCGASSPSERAARASGIGACGAAAPGPGGGQPVWARPQTRARCALASRTREPRGIWGGLRASARSFCSLMRPRDALPRTGNAVHVSWCRENKLTTWERRAAVPGLGGARFYPGAGGAAVGRLAATSTLVSALCSRGKTQGRFSGAVAELHVHVPTRRSAECFFVCS